MQVFAAKKASSAFHLLRAEMLGLTVLNEKRGHNYGRRKKSN